MKCCVCKAEVSDERAAARGPYCTRKDCVRASLLARANVMPMVLVNGHKSGYEPMLLSDVRRMAKHTKKG